jgi:PAS domain S-box-containing protein
MIDTWLGDGGEMGDRIRAYRWAATPLGLMETWPQSLRTALGIVLAIDQPAVLAWGQELVVFHNDAYLRLSGPDRHTSALGMSVAQAWPEIWHVVRLDYRQIMTGGKPVRHENRLIPVQRHGRLENVCWTCSYSPIADPAAPHGIGGTLTLVSQTLDTVAASRAADEQKAFLLKLSDTLRPLADANEIASAACEALGRYLAVGQVGYSEMDATGEFVTGFMAWTNGNVPNLTGGRFRMADYGTYIIDMRAGRDVVIPDVTLDERTSAPEYLAALGAIGIAATTTVPLIKVERLPAFLYVTHPAPRQWSTTDVELIRDVAERTWAALERARAEAALRESETRLRQFGEASSDILWTRNMETLRWEYLTPAFERIYGVSRDEVLAGNDFGNWISFILPEDQDETLRAIRKVQQGERLTFEYRIRRPVDGGIRWLRNTDFPIRNEEGRVVRIGGVGHDVTDLKEAEQALAAAERRQRAFLEGIPHLVWRAVGAGQWTWASPQWISYTGQVEIDSHGRGWLMPFHPEDREIACQAWSTAAEAAGFEVEARIYHAAGGSYRWFQTRAAPVRDTSGNIVEWLGTSTDIHELRELQERQKVLVAELQHRTRNLMGVIRSTADKTARGSADLVDFRARFRDRMDALARVQGLLSRLNEHDRVTFDDLVRTEMIAMNGNAARVAIDGPSGVRLRSSVVQTLAMALHELATNAVKYGALGQPQGHLAITWVLEQQQPGSQPWLHINWRESGVVMPPAGVRPAGRGQGRELIERALPYQLSAKTTYVFGSDGVQCTISIPVSMSKTRNEASHV